MHHFSIEEAIGEENGDDGIDRRRSEEISEEGDAVSLNKEEQTECGVILNLK